MRCFMLVSAFFLVMASPSVRAEASGYSNLLPTEQDLAKSTAAAEAKAKTEKAKAQRTGMPPIPKSKAKVALTATCKDAAGKTYTPSDIGYDSCMTQATTEAQLKRSTGTNSSTGTASESSNSTGFSFKIGE